MIESSIIVASFNRNKQLLKLLEALSSCQAKAEPFEMIIVDDGSEPPLSIDKAAYQYPITIVRQKNSGPAQARNRGAALAQGAHLIFLDDDCLPAPGWLAAFQKGAASYPRALLGGKTDNGMPTNPYMQVSQVLLDYLQEHYNPDKHLGGFFPSNNLLVPKAGFFELGGFNHRLRFSEDREFCYRWSLTGNGYRFIAEAEILHVHLLDFKTFLVHHFKYGWGTYQFRKILRKNNWRQVSIAPPDFYAKLFLYPFSRTKPTAAILLSFLLIILHLSYGCGFLWKSAHEKLR